MDRISWFGVILCVLALLFYGPIIQYFYPPQKPAISEETQAREGSKSSDQSSQAARSTVSPSDESSMPDRKSGPFIDSNQEALKIEPNLPEETVAFLENEWMRVSFTTHGGAIRNIELKKHKLDGESPVVLNRGVPEPVFNLTGWNGTLDIVGYTLASRDGNAVRFERVLENGCKVTRTYTLGENYIIHLEQTLENPTNEARALPSYHLFVGAGLGPYLQPEERNYLSGSWYTEKGRYVSHKIMEFDSGSFLLFFPKAGKAFISSEGNEPIRWAAASSQFFTQILTSIGEMGVRVDLHKKYFPELAKKNNYLPNGVETHLQMPGFALSPLQNKKNEWNLYAGPKKDALLRKMPFEQEHVMEFGWLSFISRPLLSMMNGIYKFVPNYGVAILLLTVFIKLVLWYPQSRATRNMKQMQALSPKLREIQAKYKEDPARLQQEMMKLYKEYGVNPLGGCLPLLIQLPIFIGFYYMLTSAIELRHASFLWITDLSKPDTVTHIPLGSWQFPINPMPILMTASMFWSMQLSPQPEGVENPNQKILKWMPIVMLFFCYGLSSALSLYWTMQNLLSVAQMYYNLKQPLPTLKRITQTVRSKSKK